MKNKRGLILLCAGIGMMSYKAWGMAEQALIAKPKLTVIAIPGLGGGGSSDEYLQSSFPDYELNIKRIETPVSESDLGQSRCINFVYEQLRKFLEDTDTQDGVVLHATSQGAATVLNGMPEWMHEDWFSRVKFIFFEGPFATGNRGIVHTLRGPKAGTFGPLIHLPYSETWTPYVAIPVRFWDYCPSRQQVIKSVSRLPKVPMAFIHGGGDVRVPPEDSRAIYHGVRLYGNNDAYSIQEENAPHTHVLENAPHGPALIQTLVQKYTKVKPTSNAPIVDLTPYQPDHTGFARSYHDILEEAYMHERIAPSMYAAAAVVAVYATYQGTSYLMRLAKKLANPSS